MGCEIVAPAFTEAADELQSAFPPGGRDDVLLDRVALDAVEGVGLVGLVQDADRNQEETAARGVVVEK